MSLRYGTAINYIKHVLYLIKNLLSVATNATLALSPKPTQHCKKHHGIRVKEIGINAIINLLYMAFSVFCTLGKTNIFISSCDMVKQEAHNVQQIDMFIFSIIQAVTILFPSKCGNPVNVEIQ